MYTYVSNNPLKYVDPTGHWQKGDEKLSLDKQVALEALTLLYNAVGELGSYGDSIQDVLHSTADCVRKNDYFAINGKFGTGLEGKLKVLGVGAEVGFSHYYELGDAGITMESIEAAIGIHISNQIFLGADAKASKNAETGLPIADSETAFVGLKVGNKKLGWGDIPKSGKFILESSIGGLTPLGGGELSLELNLTKIGKNVFDGIEKYGFGAADTFTSSGTPGSVTDAVFGQPQIKQPKIVVYPKK